MSNGEFWIYQDWKSCMGMDFFAILQMGRGISIRIQRGGMDVCTLLFRKGTEKNLLLSILPAPQELVQGKMITLIYMNCIMLHNPQTTTYHSYIPINGGVVRLVGVGGLIRKKKNT